MVLGKTRASMDYWRAGRTECNCLQLPPILESIGRRKNDGERRMLTQIQLGSRRTKSLCRDMGRAVGRSRPLFALSLLARRRRRTRRKGGRMRGAMLYTPLPCPLPPLPIHAFPPLPRPLVPPLQNTYVELGSGGGETARLHTGIKSAHLGINTFLEVQSIPVN